MFRSHLEVFLFFDRSFSAQFHRALSRKGAAQRELQTTVQDFLPAPALGRAICRDAGGCSSARGVTRSAEAPDTLLSAASMRILRRQTQLQTGSVKVYSSCMLPLLEAENKYLVKR